MPSRSRASWAARSSFFPGGVSAPVWEVVPMSTMSNTL